MFLNTETFGGRTLRNKIYMRRLNLQETAKRVETLTVNNRTMRVIEVSASPTPLPPKQTCFHLHLTFKLKGINIKKGGGERGAL